ncbi:hypothetical protein NXC24_PC02099 (plasmid) [Rhizobium sp. NXC24]|nr:hypothetical protein NXC24_PC02099 [Rhizobium sp. NXC24]
MPQSSPSVLEAVLAMPPEELWVRPLGNSVRHDRFASFVNKAANAPDANEEQSLQPRQHYGNCFSIAPLFNHPLASPH